MSAPLYIHTTDIHNTSAAREIMPFLLELLNPSSIVDIGCGTGTWLAVAIELGVTDVSGIDGEYVDTNSLAVPAEKFIAADLSKPYVFDRRYDLALCLEVAEHLPEHAGEILMNTICDSSETIVFSAAIPGQGGQNHINEQWNRYWIEKFAVRGYYCYDFLRDNFWNNDKIEWWYRQNIIMFSKATQIAGFLPATQVHDRIHPGLFLRKTETIQYLSGIIEKEVHKPSLARAVKSLIKAVIR